VNVNTVGLTWQPAPVGGVTILVSDGSGALQNQFTSTGSDVVSIEPGWMITAIPVIASGPGQIYVVEDVQPGDVLEFGEPVATDTRASIGTMTVDVPGYIDVGAVTPCNGFFSTTSTITLDQYAGCPSTFDLLVTSSANYAVVPVTFGGMATANLAPWPTMNVTLSNIPTADDGVGANVFEVYEGNEVAAGEGAAEVDPPDPATLPATVAPFGDYALVEGIAYTAGSGLQVYERAPATAGSASIDLSIDQLPIPSALAYDVDSRAASFSVEAPMTNAFVLWELQPSPPMPTWWVFTPPSTSAVLPQLPPALASMSLEHGESITAYVMLVSGDAWTSYADVKAVPTWRIATNAIPYVGVNATVVLLSQTFTTLNL